MQRKQRPEDQQSLALYLAWTAAAIIALLPFHAVLTTWAGANFGNIDLFRIWKEIIITLLGVGWLVLLARDHVLRKKVFGNFLIKAIGAYLLYSLLRAVYGRASGNVNEEAMLYGLISNLRYLAFFVLTWTISQRTNLLKNIWQQLVLIPAAIVVGFGLLQQWVLPRNFLEHVGYGSDTIPAIHTVDQKSEYMRLQSTLRGPNPLGAYLVLIGAILAARLAKRRNWQNGLFMVATMIVLFFSYSRSAWIGLAVSLLCLFLIRKPAVWRRVLIWGVLAVLVLGSSIYVLRDNDMVQNVVFHSDETSQSTESSNEARYAAITSSLKDIVMHPLGLGVGSAGPASTRNSQPARIAENYFIQIGQEVGIIGLVMLIIIMALVVHGLWHRRQDMLPTVLLASFIGLTAVNFISHAWADDTLALLWWGLAGAALTLRPQKPFHSRS